MPALAGQKNNFEVMNDEDICFVMPLGSMDLPEGYRHPRLLAAPPALRLLTAQEEHGEQSERQEHCPKPGFYAR